MSETQKSPSGRVKRIPVGLRGRLNVHGKDNNFVYRIVNDINDRIDQFKQAGYELVPKKDIRIGDSRVDIDSPTGSDATVSVGGGVKGYLMRQRKDWYESDQAEKRAKIKELEDQIKNPSIAKEGGTYGGIELSKD